jgi:excisionase family DNA binding protein
MFAVMSRKKTNNVEPNLLLRVSEAARLLGVQEGTLRAWLLARRLSRVRLGARCIRIPASEIQRVISEGTIPARGRRGALD